MMRGKKEKEPTKKPGVNNAGRQQQDENTW
jgi:hypothetical protein